MKTEKLLTFKDYLAGAVLANSLAWLTLGVTLSSEIDPLTFVQLLFLTYVLGAVIAGYLVSRKALQNHLSVGLKTGLGSFVFHIYVFMGVFELISGRRVLFLVDHLLILAIFVSGGFVGSFLCKQFSSGKTRTARFKDG